MCLTTIFVAVILALPQVKFICSGEVTAFTTALVNYLGTVSWNYRLTFGMMLSIIQDHALISGHLSVQSLMSNYGTWQLLEALQPLSPPQGRRC